MTRCSGKALILLLGALLAAPRPVLSQAAPATDLGRFTVLVPDFEPLEGADRRFGRDAAAELRDLLGALPTHEAISRRDIERSLDEVDRDMQDVDCPLARQLASRIDARVVLCAAYDEVGDRRFAVRATFYDVRSGEAFTVSPTEAAGREAESAARHVFEQFDRYVRHLAAVANCEGYAQSRLWQDALRNCDEALALNPDAVGARYRRARILFDSERLEDSLAELERVLQRDPIHENALQLAGYVSATLQRPDEALAYYTRYLQLDPGNIVVRMRVAYDLANAGDIPSAILLIEEGIDLEPDDPRLWEQLGGYAFAIGERIIRDDLGDAGGITPDAVRYYRRAIEAYRQVFELRGTETDPARLRSIVVAHVRLDEIAEAVSIAESALEAHGEDAGLWSAYADALRRDERIEDALAALDRVEALEPAYPNLGLRRANWLLSAGRIEDAVAALRPVAERDPERADAAARLVLADAYAKGVQQDRFDYAIQALSAVRELPNLSDETRHALNFWQGYALLQSARLAAEPRTLDVARATLPLFQEAQRLLDDVGAYPETVGVRIDTIRTNVQAFIEIQQAIIRRGGVPEGSGRAD